MANHPARNSAKQGDSAATSARDGAPRTSTRAAGAAATPARKPAVKPAAKPPAKSVLKATPAAAATAPPSPEPKSAALRAAKTADKPSNKSAAGQGATKKGESAKADKNARPKKGKLVRDSFTMPESEYDLIAAVKKRCLAKGLAVKKSEVLRAAVIGFAAQSDDAVTAALEALEVIKTGRPPQEQK